MCVHCLPLKFRKMFFDYFCPSARVNLIKACMFFLIGMAGHIIQSSVIKTPEPRAGSLAESGFL